MEHLTTDAPEQLGLFQEPRRLFVCTPSKLAAFEECPRRYRYAYVDRPSPPKGPPWAHNSLGASVHTALRSWFDLPRERRQLSELSRLLRATWVRDGYRDQDQEREAFARAYEWLSRYVQRLDPQFEPLAIERTVAAKTPTLAFSGRVDRIDDIGGELVIVDYKTGRAGLGPDDARGSRALALYAFAAEKMFRRRCRRVELHHLPTETVAAHEHTDESMQRHVRRAEQTAADAAAAEKALAAGADPDDAFPATPGSICGWCDFRRSCPVGSQRPGNEPWAAVERGLEAGFAAPEDDTA
ncbi:MAG TPA: PD-(D/E)XK nuclease family protein [Micromonosporaceae bacterium]|nr:PD-(D/E)XK nuclease family protein [Micromonosporaceae bacterium]